MNLFYKNIICLLFPLTILSYNSQSQNSLNMGANLSAGNVGFPIDGKRGLGANLEYTRTISPNGVLRSYLGYDWFQYRSTVRNWRIIQDSVDVKGLGMSLIPIRLGYQHFVIANTGFVYAEAGLSHIVSKYEHPDISRNCFSYAIGMGYKIQSAKTQYFQISLYYNHNRVNEYSNNNYLSLRVAYGWSDL